MNFEEELRQNIKKVIGLPDEPVAQTASGAMMLHEEPLARIRREANHFLNMLCNGKIPRDFPAETTLWLMLAFSQHLWKRQEIIRADLEQFMNRTINPSVIPCLDASEAQLTKDLVAEAIGSQDVRFDKPAIEAVRQLVAAFKKLQVAGNPFIGGKFGA